MFLFFSCCLFVSSREGVTRWTSGSARSSAGSSHGFRPPVIHHLQNPKRYTAQKSFLSLSRENCRNSFIASQHSLDLWYIKDTLARMLFQSTFLSQKAPAFPFWILSLRPSPFALMRSFSPFYAVATPRLYTLNRDIPENLGSWGGQTQSVVLKHFHL